MGVIRRQRQQVSLKLSSPSVEDVVSTMRSRRGQARQHGLRLKVKDDGRFAAQTPSGRYHTPPRLKGRFAADHGVVVFEGIIRESWASVDIPRLYIGMAAILAFVTVLLVVVGNPSPGSYICGVATVLFGLIGYALARLRRSSFSSDCRELMSKLITLMPGASPLGEDPVGISRLP